MLLKFLFLAIVIATVLFGAVSSDADNDDQVTLYNDSEFLEIFEVAIYKRGRGSVYPKPGDLLQIHYNIRTTDEKVRKCGCFETDMRFWHLRTKPSSRLS